MNLSCRFFLPNLIVVLSILLTPLTLFANNVDESQLMDKLEKIHGLSVDFEQRMLSRKGAIIQENQGRFTVTEDGRLYWETFEPFSQKVISDGKTIWVYDPDLEQVTLKPFIESNSDTPMLIFASDKHGLLDDYNVEKISSEINKEAFRLTPKNTNSLFHFLELYFTEEKPLKLSITDSLQQTTSLLFTEVILNPEIKDSLFQFQIPENVDVIHEDEYPR